MGNIFSIYLYSIRTCWLVSFAVEFSPRGWGKRDATEAAKSCVDPAFGVRISITCGSFPYPMQWVTWWRHQMETFSALLALCAGNSLVTGEFPHKGQWRGAFMLPLICTWNKRSSKHSWGWWFETLSHPLWRHCNETGQIWLPGISVFWQVIVGASLHYTLVTSMTLCMNSWK